MFASAMQVELRILDVRSLKAKRSVVKSVTRHLGTTFGVAVSEVDHHDLWQRCSLGVAAVAAQPRQVDRILQSVRTALDNRIDVEVLSWNVSELERPA